MGGSIPLRPITKFARQIWKFEIRNTKHEKGASDFEFRISDFLDYVEAWGRSSIGRTPALQAGGHRFDSGRLQK